MTPTFPPTAPQAHVPAGRWVVGASLLHAEVHDAEHLLVDLVAALAPSDPTALGCTHVVRTPWPHEAVSVELAGTGTMNQRRRLDQLAELIARARAVVPAEAGLVVQVPGVDPVSHGPADATAGAREAATALLQRTSGRAVFFPGQHRLTGELGLDEVLALSSIEAVTSLSGVVADDAVVVTREFVRPTFEGGVLTLRCLHEDAARLIPWEPQFVHRCGGH